MKNLWSNKARLSAILCLVLFFSTTSLLFAQGGSWESKAPMNFPRWGYTIGEIDGIFYIAGGYNPSLGRHLRNFEAYDSVADLWTIKAPKPVVQTSAASGVINGLLYTAGGSNTSYGIPSTWAYNPADETWVQKADMPSPIQFPAYGVINGKLYLTAFHSSNRAYAYDPSQNVWEVLPPSPIGRTRAAAGVINGILYVAGGNHTQGKLDVLEAYDPVTCTWTVLSPMPTPRYAAAGAVLDGKLYVLGGADGSNTLPTVEVYDPETNTWSTGVPMLTARADARAVVKDGGIYIFGGYFFNENNVTEALSSVEVFKPESDCTGLYTQEEVDQIVADAVADAESEKDIVIVELQDVIEVLEGQLAATDQEIADLTQSLQSVFMDPQFLIPGDNLADQIYNIVDAIENLNYGQQQALYKNLGGTIGKGKK